MKAGDFVDQTLDALRNAKGSYESNANRLNDLQTITKTATKLDGDTTPSDHNAYTLPDDYRGYVRFSVTVNADCLVEPKKSKGRVIPQMDLEDLLEDTHHKTTMDSPVVTIQSGKSMVYYDGFTVEQVDLVYVTNPPALGIRDNGSETYNFSHSGINRIIDMTVLELANAFEQNPQKLQVLASSKLS